MDPGPAKGIDIIFFKSSALLASKCCRISGAIFLNDLKFQLRPAANLIKLNVAGSVQKLTCKSIRFDKFLYVGNWLHSSPSSNRPRALGVRPPHCLKKNGTSALTH